MGIMTSQKIATYYDLFKSISVTYSKEIIQVTGLVPNQVYMKCVGDSWPCVVFSTSFEGAKVVVNTKSGILQKLEKANNMVSLRFCFRMTDKANPVAFFVNTRSTGYSPYGKSDDMAIFTLQFTQRPPDDLIEIMGRILDANVNSTKRRDERILITPESVRKLNLVKESAVFIQGVPRHCILRDISFSAAKIIMMGVAKFLANKEAILKMDFQDPSESFLLKGHFNRSEAVEGRKELVSLAIEFDENITPMGYKIRINDYLSQVRTDRGTEAGGVAAEKHKPDGHPAPAPAPPPDGQSARTPPAGETPAAAPANPEPQGDHDLDLNI